MLWPIYPWQSANCIHRQRDLMDLSRHGRFGEVKDPLPLSEIKPGFLGRSAYSLVTIPMTLSIKYDTGNYIYNVSTNIQVEIKIE
jgi:hypothetical protein